MAIQGIATTTPTTQTASQQTPPNQTVTQQDFLTLLITELQNQDPLNPMDDQQFATQLATFNSLQQLIDINQALGALQSGQAATHHRLPARR